jgi:hypothetical protein
VVDRGDSLYTYIYLDPQTPPDEVMLQWWEADNGWEHRAYWGSDQIQWGDPSHSPASRAFMGPIGFDWPGQWVRLEVPAAAVGLEQVVVQGFAFTLHNGKASWDYTGKTTYVSHVTASGYTAAAYVALLIGLGTSYDELRLARAATQAAREKLAARLGFDLGPSRPDELDQLLIDVALVTDDELETYFGLQRPSASVLADGGAPPLLETWRQVRVRRIWGTQDWGTGPNDFSLPIIDPDIVQVSEILGPSWAAGTTLWQQRVAWISARMSDLSQARANQPTELDALNAVIAAASAVVTLDPPLTGTSLDALLVTLESGSKIDAELSAYHLPMAAFRRLIDLRALAATGPLEPSEWDEVYAILVQIEKVTTYPQWRADEYGMSVILSQVFFTLAPAGIPITIPPWRATWDARLDWADRLRARTQQLADLDQGLQGARFTAEEASLPLLRDALVLAIGYGEDISDQLTGRLFIDVQAGPSLKVTSVDQALETLQTGLEAVLTGSIASTFDNLPQSPAAIWLLAYSESRPGA